MEAGKKWCVCDRHMIDVEESQCYLCEKEDEEQFELEEFEKSLKKVKVGVKKNMNWLEVLESGDKHRKILENCAKENHFNQMDTYVALKLWLYGLDQTEIVFIKQPLEEAIKQLVEKVNIKD